MSGKTRDGINKPLLCKWTLWDVRMYEETLPQYLSDIHTYNITNLPKGNVRKHFPGILVILMKIMRFIMFCVTRGRVVDIQIPKPETPGHPFHGFTYVIFLFAIKDPRKHDGTEIL